MKAYIHIPFCRQKCSYCKFALTPVFSDFQRKKYIHTLCQEIEEKIAKKNITHFSTLYFGGGTPSILPIQEVKKILSYFPKSIPEISFEANPEDLNIDYIKRLFSLGINRLSIGIQTLNDESLKTIERQNSNTTISALNSIKSIGVGKVGIFGNNKVSINIDLILGLPYVKKGEILQNLIFLHTNFPFITHTSVYILEKGIYPKNWKENSLSDKKMNAEFLEICEYFKEKGWNHYELSNFSKPGYECAHNLGYWNHDEYIGLGLSASEFLHQKKGDFVAVRRTNSPSFAGYYGKRIFEEEHLTKEQIELEKLLFGLRTTGYIINPKIPILSEEKISLFCTQKLLEKTGNKISLTQNGYCLIDHITENILQ